MRNIQTTIVLALAMLVAAPVFAGAQSCAPVSFSKGNYNYNSSPEASELLKKIERESGKAESAVERLKALERAPMQYSKSSFSYEMTRVHAAVKTIAADVCRLQQIAPGAEAWQMENLPAVIGHAKSLAAGLEKTIELSDKRQRSGGEFSRATSKMRNSLTALRASSSPGLTFEPAD